MASVTVFRQGVDFDSPCIRQVRGVHGEEQQLGVGDGIAVADDRIPRIANWIIGRQECCLYLKQRNVSWNFKKRIYKLGWRCDFEWFYIILFYCLHLKSVYIWKRTARSIEWRVGDGLLVTIFKLKFAYCCRRLVSCVQLNSGAIFIDRELGLRIGWFCSLGFISQCHHRIHL